MILTPNELRHARSLEEISSNPAIESRCGNPEELGVKLEDLLPLYEHNPDWEDVIIDDDLLDCALRFEDMGAAWHTKEDFPEILGEFNLLHFYDVFDQSSGPPPLSDSSPFQREFLSQLRVFDNTRRSGAGMLTYIRMQPAVTPLEIWYEDRAEIGTSPYPSYLIKLDMSYCEYLQAVTLTKGTYGWQYLYTDVSLRDPQLHSEALYLQNMLEVFPKLFPAYDYAPLRQRLEARL
ncbi:hypothetical protein [Streptomyces jumonjinensis]|uniref:SMI1/KNR4 family protein n=1 Tax=Streptomyces jumonjinensis TaxID=1945 RepID=A0A646KET2_STRJU|nr:hypothetical protein [Streptomyces jumonjinensis]MQT00799.1 hypothetical protein [Streptomyces jumonjinensis]